MCGCNVQSGGGGGGGGTTYELMAGNQLKRDRPTVCDDSQRKVDRYTR